MVTLRVRVPASGPRKYADEVPLRYREGLQAHLQVTQGDNARDYQGRCRPVCARHPVYAGHQEYVSSHLTGHPLIHSCSGYASDVTPQSLVSLVSKNTNLLIALSPKQTPLSSLAAEFSLILPPPGTPLLSHFPQRDTPPTVIPVDPPRAHNIISPGLAPVWFAGVPQALGLNPMLVPLLHAPPQAFASDADSDAGADALVEAAEKGGEGLWAGSSLSLVTGFQPLGNARVTWVGGVEMFSDEFMNKEVSKCVFLPVCRCPLVLRRCSAGRVAKTRRPQCAC